MNSDKYGLGDNLNDVWETRWKEIVKTDFDYDGDFLIRMITHKLSLMSSYFKTVEEKVSRKELKTDCNLKKVIAKIDECYNLGIKILTHDYSEEADNLFSEKGDVNWLVKPSSDDGYKEWDALCKEAENIRSKDITKFFQTIGRNIGNWWV